MRFKGDIIITDPCYVVKDDDWNKCGYGDNMEVLGINTFISRNTIYGDWSCTTFKAEAQQYTNKLNKGVSRDEAEVLCSKIDSLVLGRFCADAGLVGVFLLDEVLAYNPEFDYHINKPWTTTWIKDFDGDVEFVVENYNDVLVVGTGNIPFFTYQTGF